MKKPMIFSAAILLLAALTAAALYEKEPPEISREEYPYVGISLMSASDYIGVGDIIERDDFPLNQVMYHYKFVVGRFLTSFSEAEIDTYSVVPGVGTPVYEGKKAISDETGQTIESLCPTVSDYLLKFEVIEDISGIFRKGDVITIRNRVNTGYDTTKPLFPDVKEGDRAVLTIMELSGSRYLTGTTGFYYIDEYDRVISAEKYPSLDQYTGMKLDAFKEVLRDTYNQVVLGTEDVQG